MEALSFTEDRQPVDVLGAVRRRCTVRSGITTVSSWSDPMADLAFGLQEADHLAGKLLDANLAPHRILLTEKIVAHRFADDAHRLARPVPRSR